ncbi:hypothetical protein AAVH_26209, partial [Aphelenchoides avenae]
ARFAEYKPVLDIQHSSTMQVSTIVFVSAVLFLACSVDLANSKPAKSDSGNSASIQVGEYILSIAPAAAATTCQIPSGAGMMLH